VRPSQASDPYHPEVIPTVCSGCSNAQVSATWTNDPNHFHLDLNLSVRGCTGSEVTLAAVAPSVALEPSYAGGVVKPQTLHPATSFAFDYTSNVCSGGLSVFFVQVLGSDNNIYTLTCNDFPTPAMNVWQHENITRADLSMPPGVTMQRMYIGLMNESSSFTAQAKVRNVTVDGVAAIDVTESAQSFCPLFTGL
jgi:hypothetical protein